MPAPDDRAPRSHRRSPERCNRGPGHPIPPAGTLLDHPCRRPPPPGPGPRPRSRYQRSDVSPPSPATHLSPAHRHPSTPSLSLGLPLRLLSLPPSLSPPLLSLVPPQGPRDTAPSGPGRGWGSVGGPRRVSHRGGTTTTPGQVRDTACAPGGTRPCRALWPRPGAMDSERRESRIDASVAPTPVFPFEPVPPDLPVPPHPARGTYREGGPIPLWEDHPTKSGFVASGPRVP